MAVKKFSMKWNSISFDRYVDSNIIIAVSQEKLSSGFPTRSNTNRAVRPQKMARGLKFQIYEGGDIVLSMYKNKGADQLRGYQAAKRAADLRLCFRIMQKTGFLMTGLIILKVTSFVEC